MLKESLYAFVGPDFVFFYHGRDASLIGYGDTNWASDKDGVSPPKATHS